MHDPPAKKFEAKDFLPTREPYEGFWGEFEYFLTGGIEKGISYNRQGNPIGLAPYMGAPYFIGGGIKGGVGVLGKLGHIFRNATGHINPSTITSMARYMKLIEHA